MKNVGLVIGIKENEKRRAILPEDIGFISHPELLFVQKGYGDVCGYSDEDYQKSGCRIVSREEALNCDIVCDPKVGDAEYLDELKPGQTVFGWVHAVQNSDITNKIVNGKLTAYAWEDMFYKDRHVFFRNNELAGEAAIMHAFELYGKMPYDVKVAVLGNGNTARGAIKILTMLGASVTCYSRKSESLFKDEMCGYDVIVNCILWDVRRKDHIIYRKDLKRLRKNAMIVDISCDRCGGIETSVPTTLENPVYTVDGVLHYVVDHTPTIFYKNASQSISAAAAPYLEQLMQEEPGETLKKACIIENGRIRDERINEFQAR